MTFNVAHYRAYPRDLETSNMRISTPNNECIQNSNNHYSHKMLHNAVSQTHGLCLSVRKQQFINHRTLREASLACFLTI